MDIKSKKSKMMIGFVSWFLGIMILAVNIAGLLIEMSCYRDFPGHVKETLDGDYQGTEEFREHILNYMSDFLDMSIAASRNDREEPGNVIWHDEYAVGEDGEWDFDVVGEDESWAEWAGRTYSYYDYVGDESRAGGGYDVVYDGWNMTEKEALDFHSRIQYNTNILYRIENKGEVLYTNYENLGWNGSDSEDWDTVINVDGREVNFAMPKGYNYLLYYDGETLRAMKNGVETNIGSNGYYKGDYWDYEWYVPGYDNVPVDDTYRDSRIYMVVAREPDIIVRKNYDGKGHTYYSNRLYRMKIQSLDSLAVYRNWIYSSLIAVALVAVGLAFRRYRKEAYRAIAGVTGKIWYEVKLLPVLLSPCLFVAAGISFLKNMWWQGTSFLYELRDYSMSYGQMNVFIILVLDIFFVLVWLFVNDARYNKKPWEISLTGKIAGLFRTSMFRLPFSRRMVRYNVCAFLLNLMLLLAFVMALAASNMGNEILLVAALLLLGGVFFLQSLYVRNMRRMAVDIDYLVGRIEAVHNGELQECGEIPEESGLAQAMENLDDIRDGMNRAIDRQIKSERMKVELITNVSHDIKTPLTSIISYVELLKQEEGLPEHVKEYVSILENKSQRLKAMVQDVFEVSKAASGELPVHMEHLDLGKLIYQTIADMQQQIEDSPVSIKCEIPDKVVTIYADGDRLYRVFQNLIQNALKYSLEGSRVYINLNTGDGDAVASVKNTSREELSPGIDFTERFIRGDSSRTDGGSGLGLSIAQSFTEACGGTFKVETIADLFVVTVSFHRSEV